MVQLDNLKSELYNYDTSLTEINNSLDIPNKEKRIIELNRMMEEPGFWNDPDKANKLTKELKDTKNEIDFFNALKTDYDDIFAMIDIANEENDEKLIPEINKMFNEFKTKIDNFKTKLLLSGEYDNLDAIIRLNAGSGGTESCDFCQMLFRMYTKYVQSHNFNMEVIDYLDGDEAGLKSVTFEITGENAYGYMKGEKGVHRLVRISPFDAGGRRHTSFASVEVMPEITDDIELDINPEDIKMDVYRASGAGGQHINKTSSAVRLTHVPTNIVVSCQTQRSQFQNKDMAMKMLKSKLLDLKEKEQKETIAELKGEQRDIAWGSQIRSYIFCPYTLVKDHRTNFEVGNVQSVMDGELDGFIESYLKFNNQKR